MEKGMKVGELAKRTGLTVRTLHHYDEIGLLAASRRTGAGHRLYEAEDVRRLQQISALRHLGLSLDRIRECLDGGQLQPVEVVSRQIIRIERQIKAQRELVRSLRKIEGRLRKRESVAVEDLLHTIRETIMFEKHYSKEQLGKLERRAEEVGQDRIQQVQQEWAHLFKGMEDAMNAGTDPSDPSVQALARKAVGLIGEFTGGDAGIRQSLSNAYREERPAMHQAWGISEDVGAYYGRAMEALGTEE
jgi:DNA-binding transcriptional MerR regulator